MFKLGDKVQIIGVPQYKNTTGTIYKIAYQNGGPYFIDTVMDYAFYKFELQLVKDNDIDFNEGIIELDPEEFEKLEEMIANPSPPNQKLIDAIRRHTKGKKMTKKQQLILDFLRANQGFVKPKFINMTLGNKAANSSWASQTLKQLASMGLAARNEKGQYSAVAIATEGVDKVSSF